MLLIQEVTGDIKKVVAKINSTGTSAYLTHLEKDFDPIGHDGEMYHAVFLIGDYPTYTWFCYKWGILPMSVNEFLA